MFKGRVTKVCNFHRVIYGFKQSRRTWFTKFWQFILAKGLITCIVDCMMFQEHTSIGSIILAIPIHAVIVTRRDISWNAHIKAYLLQHVTWDLGTLKYFLGIEFDYWREKFILNQQIYVLDKLEERRLLGCISWSSPFDSKPNLGYYTSLLLVDVNVYCCLWGSSFIWWLLIQLHIIQKIF